jgi:phosphoribosylformylglycinamidine synthase subunit PurS
LPYTPAMLARIFISPKKGVLDPQGQAVEKSLQTLGFTAASRVSLGKFLEITLDEQDPAKAKAMVEAMCQKLLANTVMEQYRVEILPPA